MQILKEERVGNVHRVHLFFESEYYIVSNVGEETLIFPSNPGGDIVSWTEIGGSLESSVQDVLSSFKSFLY